MSASTFLHSGHSFSSSTAAAQQALVQFQLPFGSTDVSDNNLAVATVTGRSRVLRTPEPWMYEELSIEPTVENHGSVPDQQRLCALQDRDNQARCHAYPSSEPPSQQHGLLTPPELRSMDISDEESLLYGEKQQQNTQDLNTLSYTAHLLGLTQQSSPRRHCQPLALFDFVSPSTESSSGVTTAINTLADTSQHIDSQQCMQMMHEATNRVLSLASSPTEHAVTPQANHENRYSSPGSIVCHPSHHLQPPQLLLRRVNSAESFVSSTPSSPLIFTTLPASDHAPPMLHQLDYLTPLAQNNGTGCTRHLSSSEMSNVDSFDLDMDLMAPSPPPPSPPNAQEYYHQRREALAMRQHTPSSASLPSSFSSNCSYSSASPASSLPASPMLELVTGPFQSRTLTRSSPATSSSLHKNKNGNRHGRRSAPIPLGSNASTTSAFTKTTLDSSYSSSFPPASMKKNKARFVCQIPNCQRTFSRPFNLKSHGLTHETERPHGCGLCSKSFARIHDRDRHRKGHLVEKAHSCVVCLGRFARQDAVTRHLKLANEQNPCSLILKSRGLNFRDAAAGRITREMLGGDESEIRRMLDQLEDLSRRTKATKNLKMGMMSLTMSKNLGFENQNAIEMESELGPMPQTYYDQDW
ncbi:hypothetical protein EMPS_10496 [Entomortierella parvispora]|uniref:C2H2-type domain-containing protein n=1 Tax=Entomortierella parvispora TaxID=205924 RepID=A0A9P3HKZ2_9FUNG|nr:hypothetical protein EMPS_10496 [Entomortierella parvispora]